MAKKNKAVEDGNADDASKKIKRKRLDNHQIAELESAFQKDYYPNTQVKEELAKTLGLTSETVNKWFTNRRVKLRAQGGGEELKKQQEQTKEKSHNETAKPKASESNLSTSSNNTLHSVSQEVPMDVQMSQKESETGSEFATPLSKQIPNNIKDMKNGKEEHDLSQRILSFIAKARQDQGLPPFFAMITGPTFTPYRMEEFSIVLGRNSPTKREADIHVGNYPKISHQHAIIEFDKENHFYKLVNLSKNGCYIKTGTSFALLKGIGESSPLPNPAVLNIEGILVFFQIFYISDKAIEVYKPAPPKPRRVSNRALKSYAFMIESALRHHKGEATYKEIVHYIGETFPDDVIERKTWKNSVGGVLSSNALFESGSLPDAAKDQKRGRGGLWKLKNFSSSAAPLAMEAEEDVKVDDSDTENKQ